MFLLITKAHATSGGVGTIFDYLPKHSSYIHNNPPVYPLLSSQLDPHKPVLQERSKQETKIYCKLVIILITKALAAGGGVYPCSHKKDHSMPLPDVIEEVRLISDIINLSR